MTGLPPRRLLRALRSVAKSDCVETTWETYKEKRRRQEKVPDLPLGQHAWPGASRKPPAAAAATFPVPTGPGRGLWPDNSGTGGARAPAVRGSALRRRCYPPLCAQRDRKGSSPFPKGSRWKSFTLSKFL